MYFIATSFLPEQVTIIKIYYDVMGLILLYKRLSDLMELFPRGRSALSAIFNAMVRHIVYVKGHLITNLNQSWLSPVHVQTLCRSLAKKVSPYTRYFGFLDGTIRPTCRTTYNQRQVKIKCFTL